MNRARRQRTAIAWLCAAAILLLGFIAHQHALSHGLATLQSPVPHDPVAGHMKGCELCLQLAGADAALPQATVALAHGPLGYCVGVAAVLPCRAQAFAAYSARAPPRRG